MGTYTTINPSWAERRAARRVAREHSVAKLAHEPPKYSPEWYEREDDLDWRRSHPGRARDEKRAFRKALRSYRRHVRPMADEPHSLLDSWPFLIPFGLMCVGVLLARAWGWL